MIEFMPFEQRASHGVAAGFRRGLLACLSRRPSPRAPQVLSRAPVSGDEIDFASALFHTRELPRSLRADSLPEWARHPLFQSLRLAPTSVCFASLSRPWGGDRDRRGGHGGSRHGHVAGQLRESAAEPLRDCAPRHAMVLLSDRRAVVFRYRFGVYSCLRRRGPVGYLGHTETTPGLGS